MDQDITLVDLPGVGVVRDVHAEVTRKWIREKAHAIVLVVDHRGMTESLADALRRSEFLNSLLYSTDEPDEDPIVIIAITRIDDVANEQYRQDKSKKKYEHFEIAAAQAKSRLRDELCKRLQEIWLSDGDITDARKQVVQNLLATLQVHPVSAPEYVRLIANDDDDRPFLEDESATGIPSLIDSLTELAQDHNARVRRRLKLQTIQFHQQLISRVRLLEAQVTDDVTLREEIERLRKDLEVFTQPLRIELANRQGGYRTFLKKSLPKRIEDLVSKARLKASRDIDRYLTKLGTAHWGTLRASVRRGGRYAGATDINLPTECALRFEEPVAEVWSKEILLDIRRETREYSEMSVALVEQVTEWALRQGARVNPKIIEAQRDAIRADAKKLESVGREMVKEMRDEAKAQLVNVIEGPIGSACKVFVKKNLDVGPGVKMRILELYRELADKVTEAAEVPARKILLKLFKDVEKEILAAFNSNIDPLTAICDAVLNADPKDGSEHSAYRKTLHEEIKHALAEEPDLACLKNRNDPANAAAEAV